MSEVIIDGVAYEAVEQQGCNGCAFKNGDKCSATLATPNCRTDDVSMIFVKKEMACHGDGEWDAKYETFERHYPLIKWAVVSGLLGLVWLVSM